MAKKELIIKATMEERWIPYFQSFLHYMQSMGNLGHSCFVGFYADGDGDFKPKFEYEKPFEKVEGITREEIIQRCEENEQDISWYIPEKTYDAG